MAKKRSSTANGQHAKNGETTKDDEPQKYRVLVSQRFVVLSLLACILAAFAVGRTARMLLLVNPQKQMLEMTRAISEAKNGESKEESTFPAMKTLPDPKMKEGKTAPETIYTSKTFGTGSTGSSQSRWIVTEAGKEQCVDLPDHQCTATPAVNNSTIGVEAEEEHLPAGQHLLLDIENVDESFLNSEERLAHAMLELVGECGLTLLSYHCHKMVPMGVSCAGVLLESHVSFHTWPKEGVITLDLYTCGPNSLLPIVPMAQELFAVPREGVADATQPNIVWAHKTRGFPDDKGHIAEQSDLEYFPVGKMTDYKNEIAYTATNFQMVRVYDVLLPGSQSLELYEKSLSNDGSYESNNPELFEPDRIVYLDGVLQSRRTGEAAYHETLIHPSMFAHKNPKRVAIIGGGEGASLREVLKHKTVENVTMIEIDEIMVDVSRKHIPSWSDCSELKGSTESCFDDPRVEVQYRDAFQWFIDNFPEDTPSSIEPFDVIVMDALDPQIQKDFVNALYDSSGPFLKSIPNALSDDGIFTCQVGMSTEADDAPEQFTENRNRFRLVSNLSKLGFSTARSYTDGAQSGFSDPWQFITAFRNPHTKADWFANPSLVNLKIRTRSMETVDGGSPFKYFDGATMQSFYYPDRFIADVWCKDSPDSKNCERGQGFDQNRENLPLSTIEVRNSSVGENAGKGVFATADIPRGSYIGLKEQVSGTVRAKAQTYDTFLKTSELSGGKLLDSALGSYIREYGEISSGAGMDTFVVDSTTRSLINHACDGKNNVGVKLGISQSSANPEEVAQEIIERYEDPVGIYNPAADRQVNDYVNIIPLKDIKKGEEYLSNYLASSGKSPEKWEENVAKLRKLCE